MNATRWNRISELLAGAMELRAEARELFLDRESEGDVLLRNEVASLLAAQETSGILDLPLFRGCSTGADFDGRILAGRYEVDRLIARGGMASVYLARDRQVAGRRVILKFLHAWARHYEVLKVKLLHEMEALARIEHHAVVGVLDCGETMDGMPFLVIEYIDGVTLRAEFQKGPMPVARAASIVRQTGRAVTAAHSRGVLHRDLKPENIMLELPGTAEECVRLIDFGIARLDEPDASAPTQFTQLAGTTAYMAPEQLRGKAAVTSDVYALGVVAYEMLAGTRPFAAVTPVDLYEQQRAGAKSGPLRRAGVPDHAERLILKQLSFDARDRSASAREAGDGIAAALAGPMSHKWSRRRVAAILAATGTGSAAGYLWFRAWHGSLSPDERVIELLGATEPLEHGFRPGGSIEFHAINNSNATSVDATRFVSGEQGWYSHALTGAQAAASVRRGWRAVVEAKVEEGSLFCGVDHQDARLRYAMNLFRGEAGSDVVRLVSQAVPVTQGKEWTIPGPSGSRHSLVMVFDPITETTALWVDGAQRLSGGPGLADFRYRRGLDIGLARYHSAGASAVLWRTRLEIG